MLLSLAARVSEATQQNSVVVKMTNTSTSGCHLIGYPKLALLSDRGKRLPFLYRHGDQMITTAAPRRVDLQTGEAAFFGVSKSTCVRNEQAVARIVRVVLGGAKLRVTLRHSPMLVFCGRGREYGEPVAVSPFVSTEREVFAH